MDYIRFAISNPVKVTVGVLLLLLFGTIALVSIPVQLVPNVERPIITVQTSWTGRSPEEVEREIIDEQEDKLKGVSDLKKMTSTSSQGKGSITLEFYIGVNIDRALQEVSDKLRQVPEYPDDVDEPVITAADASNANAIAWLILYSQDSQFDVQGFFDTADRRIKPYLERVAGLSRINIYGGRERQIHIRVDPKKLAHRGITFSQLINALRLENVNVSAGEMAQGRLDVRIRTVGQYDNLEDIRRTVVAHTDGGLVRVRDLGDVVATLEKRRSFVRARSRPALAFQVIREVDANVMDLMAQLRQRIDKVNRDLLPRFGDHLRLEQVYDETVYIEDAIDLVQTNVVVGGALAMSILLLFLRTLRPTVIVALAIPISVVGTFVVMAAFGRTLNVVSLAGLAFSVGMVVDNAIVVLENIDRHLGMGKEPARAAYDATREVWGAIVASTLTTLAVFVPVLTLQEEAGQLVRDIALAICAAVSLSLLVSVTVIPTAAAYFVKTTTPPRTRIVKQLKGLFGLTAQLEAAGSRFSQLIYAATSPTRTGIAIRLVVAGSLTGAALVGAAWLKPPTTYLPKGNRNLVFAIMFTPPGYNIDHAQSIADRVEAIVQPYWQTPVTPGQDKRPPIIDPFTQQLVTGIPRIENFFFVRSGGTIFMGASSQDKNRVAPLESVLNTAMSAVPGAFGFAKQFSLFGQNRGGSNAVDVELSATQIDQLRTSADVTYKKLGNVYGYGSIRPDPLNFNLAGPELQLKIDRVSTAELGMDVSALGLTLQTLVEGATVGDYRDGDESIDLLMIRHPAFALTPDTIGMVPVATNPSGVEPGHVIPLSTVVQLTRADAPQQINHIEQLRSIKLTVVAPETIALETLTTEVTQMVGQLRGDGAIAPEVEVNLAGTADQLSQLRQSLLGQWHGPWWSRLVSVLSSRLFLALLVTYLLMAALFESFLYPFVIMFSVPLAMVGGFLGLAIMHFAVPSQHLDVVTMLGFVILIGIVVNNAILIVHQSLNFMKGTERTLGGQYEALGPREAIRQAVGTRIRPIFMTTLTSVFGMLPLVLAPGSGSELYKGLGSVVVGGLMVATVFTLIVVPLVFSLALDFKGCLGLDRDKEAVSRS